MRYYWYKMDRFTLFWYLACVGCSTLIIVIWFVCWTFPSLLFINILKGGKNVSPWVLKEYGVFPVSSFIQGFHVLSLLKVLVGVSVVGRLVEPMVVLLVVLSSPLNSILLSSRDSLF